MPSKATIALGWHEAQRRAKRRRKAAQVAATAAEAPLPFPILQPPWPSP